MNWITWLLTLLGLVVLARTIFLILKTSASKKRTIRLTERNRQNEANPGFLVRWIILFLLLMAAFVAVQFLFLQM